MTLDALEHSGTITAAMGDIQAPVVALTSNHPVIFTLNQDTMNFNVDRFVGGRAPDGSLMGSMVLKNNTGQIELDELIFEISPEAQHR